MKYHSQPRLQAGREDAMNIKKILNPVDGSEQSIKSTRYAIGLAKLMDAKIVLMHCHDRFPIILAEPYFQQVIDDVQKVSEELVKPFVDMLEEAKADYEVRLVEGAPGNKIPELAKIEKIDLIIMGSRGVTAFAGLFLGSVAHQVLNKSDCPVFIAK